ncbi:5-carboxymethyl-2-hydroxymuconate isomerase [Bradyrhizobium sp. UNPF46]|uniref:fumarylacetoacetate hydrolase family protein n=1 Tax=Bradyrhizobium sp. UNPF46 TaxID=1141168 RepID=UPI0011519BCE|nr:fumarylacetoacetate hydrolase family protein [Bradyrhizobium sp. UNPF46]TQF27624.1 5-carboxymethyl-2-hydroxymuconate isomerase [Bradyrhizobium sp. UNPF46]
MKLTSFTCPHGDRFGIVVDGGIVDLSRRFDKCPDLKTLISTTSLEQIARHSGMAPDYNMSEITVRPPIPNPDKIICIGINYHAHLAEVGLPKPDYPMVFLRLASSQVGNGALLIRPKESEQFDYEGELAIVIGKKARRVSEENAFEFVAGYSCYNEGTIRDWQSHTRQISPGKNFPATAAFGPWLVTKDEVPDLRSLILLTRINGQEVQRAQLDDMIFSVPQLVAYCSRFTELVPGDVISTGTTGGVGAYRKPPLWMKPGDTVEVEISSVGKLKNSVVAE